MPSTSDHHIKNFTDYLRFQKRYSKHTLVAYERDLLDFHDYMQMKYADVPVTEATAFMVRSWLAGLKEANLSSRTINRKISSLKSFYRHLLKTGVVKTHPMGQVVSPKTSKRLPQYVEQEGMETLLSEVDFGNDFEGLTRKLILQMLYYTGMRRSELIGLKERNIDSVNKTIKVLGKGSRERVIPIGDQLIKELQAYKQEKEGLEGEVNREVILVNKKGRPVSEKFVYHTVKQYLAMVTTLEKKSPHILRHSFATHLSANGADLNAIKELLGHSSLAATQIYTHNNIQKLKNIHEKAHPRS